MFCDVIAENHELSLIMDGLPYDCLPQTRCFAWLQFKLGINFMLLFAVNNPAQVAVPAVRNAAQRAVLAVRNAAQSVVHSAPSSGAKLEQLLTNPN